MSMSLTLDSDMASVAIEAEIAAIPEKECINIFNDEWPWGDAEYSGDRQMVKCNLNPDEAPKKDVHFFFWHF